MVPYHAHPPKRRIVIALPNHRTTAREVGLRLLPYYLYESTKKNIKKKILNHQKKHFALLR